MSVKIVIGICAALAIAAPLAGCGKLGELQRPGPLNGAGGSAAKPVREAPRPIQTVDPRDPDSDPAPPRTNPIQGQGQNPFGQAPQGALPNPYANPRP
jgi:hypothetical protein